MKLICFPHYTCGGLLCDILNNTFSPISNYGGIASVQHNQGKLKISSNVLTEFDTTELLEILQRASPDLYIGTHCWPGELPHDKFDKIINITTATERSRIYRWVRAYQHYYKPLWGDIHGIELFDKLRETAKQYLNSFPPVFHPNVYNLEFSEVVDHSCEFNKLFENIELSKHITRWADINLFLYDSNFWNCQEVKAYYEASYELELQKHYVYN